MENIGAKLKKIRLEKGISLEEVHKKTRIHMNVLEAIENESLVNLSEAYVRGFVKIYCRFLKVDPKDVAPEYKSSRVLPVKESGPSKQKEHKKLPSVKLGESNSFLKLKKVLVIALGLVLVILLIFSVSAAAKKVSAWFKSRRAASTAAAVKSEKPGQQKKAPQARATAQKPANTAVSAPAEKLRAESSSGIRLGIRVKEDCFIELRVDGKLVFKNILQKNSFESWQAKEKIEFSLGNAGGVDLEVNGKLMPPLGRRGQVVKNIVITRDGLEIER